MNRAERMAAYSDQELVAQIKNDKDYLGEVYKRSKEYCLNFMRNMINSTFNAEELQDVYHDACMILTEKINGGNFELTSSLQTYLNSVCRFQLLNKLRQESRTVPINDYIANGEYDDTINIGFDDYESDDEELSNALEVSFEKIKMAGGNCYEMIILFWYDRKSMNELTDHFGYSNSGTTKNQKARCQKRLKKMVFNALQS